MIACVRVCILILFECRFTLFNFPDPILLCLRGVVGLVSVMMTELNRGKRLGALSVPLFLPLELAASHTDSFPFFR